MKILVALLMVFGVSGSATAQDVNGDFFQSLLVPIAFRSGEVLPGAFGTLWAGEIWLHNGSTAGFPTLQPGGVCMPSCDINVPSGFRGRLGWVNSNHNAAMLQVPATDAGRVFVSARLLELSRQSQPTGVEVPVVKEADFFVGERWILGVPLSAGTRAALRVYDPYARADTAIEVDFFASGSGSADPGVLLQSAVLRPGDDPNAGYSGIHPPQVPTVAASLNLASDFPVLASHQFVDIRLNPIQEGRAYWAMANVTHNDTQHVLLVTSQP